MKLIVTGASGFIGRNVLLRAPRDWEIVAVYNSASDLEAFLEFHELSNVRAMRCDLVVRDEVQRLSETIGPMDAMLYLAANGDPAASAEQPRWDLEMNTVTFVTCLEHLTARHVVFVSSGAVYDGLRGEVSPAAAVSPSLPYAISKLASEQYLRFFVEHRKTVESYINVRFFGAYGPYEASRKITTRWLQAMAAGQREFVIRGDGRNLIDFMYVDDAVEGLLAIIVARGERLTIDFSSGMPVSVNDIVRAMAESLGVNVAVRHEGTVPEYIEFRSTDRTMRDRFGVTPSVTFQAGLGKLRTFLDAPGSMRRG